MKSSIQIDRNIKNLDWITIRQALSLALLVDKKIVINNGGKFLNTHPEFKPFFLDIEKVIKAFNLGECSMDGDTIVYSPGRYCYGIYSIESREDSSLIEQMLFLMPSLAHTEFRSILELTGVTHSPYSYPTAFIKETFLPLLEMTGYYGSLLLRKFGFHGFGGGSAEARIYPNEHYQGARLPFIKNGIITSARIFISGLSSDLARKEKEILEKKLELSEKKVSIIEVRNAVGRGNSIQIFVNYGILTLVIFHEMRVLDKEGNPVFNEGEGMKALGRLCQTAVTIANKNYIPNCIIREIMPYWFISGNNIDRQGITQGMGQTEELCRILL